MNLLTAAFSAILTAVVATDTWLARSGRTTMTVRWVQQLRDSGSGLDWIDRWLMAGIPLSVGGLSVALGAALLWLRTEHFQVAEEDQFFLVRVQLLLFGVTTIACAFFLFFVFTGRPRWFYPKQLRPKSNSK